MTVIVFNTCKRPREADTKQKNEIYVSDYNQNNNNMPENVTRLEDILVCIPLTLSVL